MIPRGVNDDPPDPRIEVPSPLKRRPLAHRGRECVLDRVKRRLAIPSDRSRHTTKLAQPPPIRSLDPLEPRPIQSLSH